MAKYYQIKVHHIPSGKIFFSKGREDKEVDTDDIKKDTLSLLKACAKGSVSYLSFEREGDTIVIPKQILLESVLTLEHFGD